MKTINELKNKQNDEKSLLIQRRLYLQINPLSNLEQWLKQI